MTVARPMEIERPLFVGTYDVDFAGVVSNIAYLRWLEDMRLAVLDEYCPWRLLVTSGLAPTLVETHIHYRAPVRLLDHPVARMWIGDMSRAWFSFDAEIHVDDRLTTTSHQVACITDMSTGRPVPVPAEFREKYRQLHEPNDA